MKFIYILIFTIALCFPLQGCGIFKPPRPLTFEEQQVYMAKQQQSILDRLFFNVHAQSGHISGGHQQNVVLTANQRGLLNRAMYS